MSLIADIILLLAALVAAFYCRVLANRLRNLGQTDRGLGGAISTLSFQVDEMKAALHSVSTTADQRAKLLTGLANRADATARRLELVLASLHEAEDRQTPPVASPQILKLSPDDRIPKPDVAPKSQKSVSQLLSQNRTLAKPEYIE